MNKSAEAAETPAPEAVATKNPLMTKIKIGGIVLAIMISELVMVLMLMPSSKAPALSEGEAANEHEEAAVEEHHTAATEEPKGHGGASKEEKGHGGGHGAKEGEHPKAPPKAATASEEVDLGEFSVTSYQPTSNTTLFISFHLFGTLLHKNNDELQRRLDDNKHRVRDNIIIIIRSAEVTDLTDAGLGLIKRRILETTNKTLGKPLLQAIVFSEFSFVEQ